jgi:hypothetical protein
LLPRTKADQLYRRAIVNDHRRADSIGRRARWIYDGLSFESSIEVFYFEGNMRDGPDELGYRTIRLESHPLYAKRTCAETRHEDAELRQMHFAGTNDGGWNADVVVTPAELRRDSWGFMIQPAGLL